MEEDSDLSKGELIELIKEWKKIDDELKAIQKGIKERRDKKKQISLMLVKVMRDNEIDCFDINNGKLIYTKNKVKCPLNKEYLISAIHKFLGNNKNNECEKLTEFILENRETKIKEGIRCKTNKN